MSTQYTTQNSLLFNHHAMNTTFAIRFPTTLANTYELEAIAGNCFQEIDRLEDLLSRFREESEIAQINRLKTGEQLILHEDTYRILQQGFELYMLTQGIFNITIGAHTWSEEHKDKGDSYAINDKGAFSLDTERPIIYCIQEGRQLDLGGIGKGYALDQLKKILANLSIPSALLCAGNSTYLAIGEGQWDISLTGEQEQQKITLENMALSVSGTSIQGSHIVNPFAIEDCTYSSLNLWLTCNEASYADAFSTTCFLLNNEELKSFLEQNSNITSVFVEASESKQIMQIK